MSTTSTNRISAIGAHMTMRTGSLLAAAALVLVGCSSTPDHTQEYTNRLMTADEALADGDLRTAHQETVRLIDLMEENGLEGYELQRALAEAVLLAIHASAGPENGFLTEPGRFSGQLDSTDGRVTSETAHRIAALFHAWRLLEREPQLANASPTVGDVTVAPGRLAKLLPAGMTKGYARLIIAGSFAQLGYEDESRALLREFDHPEYGQVFTKTTAEADLEMVLVMNEYGLPPRLQWYLLAMGYEVHKQIYEDKGREGVPTLAYRLGCLAAFGPLEEVDDGVDNEHSGEVVDPDFKDAFYLWVKSLEAEHGRFVSTGKTKLVLGVVGCGASGEPAIDFRWEPNDD